MRKIPCPYCWHEETLKARLNNREPCRDDSSSMYWVKPYGGPRGQQVTKWDGGRWHCEICDISLTAREAGVFLDAALMNSDPDCDSIVDGLHQDTHEALKETP
jgi:hypothetical protein